MLYVQYEKIKFEMILINVLNFPMILAVLCFWYPPSLVAAIQIFRINYPFSDKGNVSGQIIFDYRYGFTFSL